ncbi:MAG: DNA methyltransferase [Chloroflexi bacterium]|nr:DNA methyltransferase [Chloroflexota bacterium]
MAEPNFKNRTLYHGDNLDFLRGMNSETVHLIATDPPFNKNRDFHATPDSLAKGASFKDRWSWDRDVHEDWTDSIKDDWPAVWEVIDAARVAYGNDMGAFLCWIGVRLMEMHRILRLDGTLYLHLDHTAVAYVKCLLDGIFGRKNFITEIIWNYGTPSGGRAGGRKPIKSHETLLVYAKKYSEHTYNKQYTPYSENYRTKWFRHTDADGRKYRTRTRGGKIIKQYLDESPGVPLSDTWSDIKSLYGSSGWFPNTRKEITGYPTQKPLALYERIVKASSNEGDIVLDPFCGCATTPVAAERLKRQWVGMDIWDGALNVVRERMERDTILRADDSNHVTLPKIHYETEPPERSDENEIAAPTLRLRIQRPVMPWEKLSHRVMTNILAAAQGSNGGVICAGCGRALEREFMQLDHITPKSDRGANHILNRILLCGPCNRRKRDNLTLRGLMRENKKKAVGWMKDEGLAKMAQDDARDKAEWVRDYFDTPECQEMIRGG